MRREKVLENLYRKRWTELDGLGALIISPTRELAVQIYEVLIKVGKYHTFSAGLVIGGKDVDVEKERLGRMNILVSTPGRLLQHLDETSSLDCANLQLLGESSFSCFFFELLRMLRNFSVLDEADRILDMGFSVTLNAILDHLPTQRQTLLYSATQTKSVKDLARLSLQHPEYVAVHEQSVDATPSSLTQHYVVVELPAKLDVLFSFMKSHLKSKTMVFFSSCKQVRFVYEAFCKLQPGVSLLQLHGHQKQQKRVEIFETFARRQHAYLLTTDLAARGLDFPKVDWVVQVDCPEDPATYIHRVGRTARYDSTGQALLFLLPSEEPKMVPLLKEAKIPIELIKIRSSKQVSIQPLLQSFCFKEPEIKYLAQRAFICYLRSIFLQRNKEVFDVTKIPAEEFSQALGLPGMPRIRLLEVTSYYN